MRLTLTQLEDAGACSDAKELFAQLFPDGVEVTPELAAQYAGSFDWDWAATELLAPSARAEFEKATVPAWAEFREVRSSDFAEYNKARAAAAGTDTFAEYKRVMASAGTEFGRVTDRAQALHDNALARAWAQAYNSAANGAATA